jgi:hypothetical protein
MRYIRTKFFFGARSGVLDQQFIEAKVRRERAGLLLDGGVEDFWSKTS